MPAIAIPEGWEVVPGEIASEPEAVAEPKIPDGWEVVPEAEAVPEPVAPVQAPVPQAEAPVAEPQAPAPAAPEPEPIQEPAKPRRVKMGNKIFVYAPDRTDESINNDLQLMTSDERDMSPEKAGGRSSVTDGAKHKTMRGKADMSQAGLKEYSDLLSTEGNTVKPKDVTKEYLSEVIEEREAKAKESKGKVPTWEWNDFNNGTEAMKRDLKRYWKPDPLVVSANLSDSARSAYKRLKAEEQAGTLTEARKKNLKALESAALERASQPPRTTSREMDNARRKGASPAEMKKLYEILPEGTVQEEDGRRTANVPPGALYWKDGKRWAKMPSQDGVEATDDQGYGANDIQVPLRKDQEKALEFIRDKTSELADRLSLVQPPTTPEERTKGKADRAQYISDVLADLTKKHPLIARSIDAETIDQMASDMQTARLIVGGFGIGEGVGTAWTTTPESRAGVLAAVRYLSARERPRQERGWAARTAENFLRGGVDFLRPFMNALTRQPDLEEDQEIFRRQLAAALDGTDALVHEDDPFYARWTTQAAGMTLPMVYSVTAGRLLGPVGRVIGGRPVTGAKIFAGIGAGGAFVPQIYDDTYFQLREEGIPVGTAQVTAAVSAVVQGVIETLEVNPLFGKTIGKFTNTYIRRFKAAILRYGKETAEEFGQAIWDEGVKETARVYEDQPGRKGFGAAFVSAMEQGWDSMGPLLIMMGPGMVRDVVLSDVEESIDKVKAPTAPQGRALDMPPEAQKNRKTRREWFEANKERLRKEAETAPVAEVEPEAAQPEAEAVKPAEAPETAPVASQALREAGLSAFEEEPPTTKRFPSAVEAAKAGKSWAQWQQPISDAFVAEEIDETDPEYQTITDSSFSHKEFNAARDVHGKQVRVTMAHKREPLFGTVTDISDDFRSVTVTAEDGSTSLHSPVNIDILTDYIQHRESRGKDATAEREFIARQGESGISPVGVGATTPVDSGTAKAKAAASPPVPKTKAEQVKARVKAKREAKASKPLPPKAAAAVEKAKAKEAAVKPKRDANTRVEELARVWDAQARKTEGGRGLAVGSGNIEFRWRADAMRMVAQGVREGKTPQQAGKEAKVAARVWIAKHNARRPKDINWKRSDGSVDTNIDTAVRMFLQEAPQPVSEPKAKKVETEAVEQPLPKTKAGLIGELTGGIPIHTASDVKARNKLKKMKKAELEELVRKQRKDIAPEDTAREQIVAKRDAALKKVRDAGKTAFNVGVPSEFINASLNLASAQIQLGAHDFKAFIKKLSAQVGEADVQKYMPQLQKMWGNMLAVNEKEAAPLPKKAVEKKPAKPKKAEAEAPGHPEDMTGVKVAKLDEQAAALGQAPPNPFEAVKAIDLLNQAIADLTPESDLAIQGRAAEVVANPLKPISLEEAIDFAASLDFNFRKAEDATKRYNDHKAKGEDAAAERAEMQANEANAAVYVLQQAARNVGRQWAYMGHIYQLLVDKDGKAHIDNILRRANAGLPIDEAWVDSHVKKVDKSKKDQAERGKEIDESGALEAANARVQQLEEELETERKTAKVKPKRGKRNKVFTETAKDAAIARIRARAPGIAGGVPIRSMAAYLADAAVVAGYHVEAGVRSLADFSKAMVKDLGDGVKPHLEELYRKARAEVAVERKKVLHARIEKADDVQSAQSSVEALAKEILAETRKDDGSFITTDELVDLLHEELKTRDENITRRETNDLFAGYGQSQKLSKDDLDVAYRERRGEGLQLSKLATLIKDKLAPLFTGRERQEPTRQESEYIKQINELKRVGEAEGWYKSGEGRLRSTLDADKKRMWNEIIDINAQIESGKKTVRKKREPLTTNEREWLRSLLEAKRKRYNEVFKTPGLTDKQRAELYEKSLQRDADRLQKQLDEGDVFPKAAKALDLTAKAKAIKAEIAALNAEKELMRQLLDPQFRANKALAAKERAAERQIAKLEAERDAGFKMKEKPEPGKVSPKLIAAQVKLDALRKQRRLALEDAYALKAAIAQSLRNAANIKDRIARGDFAPRTKKAPTVWDDPTWLAAKKVETQLGAELSEKIAGYEWDNLGGWETAGIRVRRGVNVWKGVFAGFDATHLGLQGGVAMVTHPAAWVKSLMPMAESMRSQENRDLLDAKREADERYADYIKWGLAVSHPGEPGSIANSEQFSTDRFMDRIPGVAISSRSFHTFLNELRMNVMKTMEWLYSATGGGPLNDTTGPAMVRVVNAFTMSWNPQGWKSKGILRVASEIFWAPSMYAARFQSLAGTPIWWNKGADTRIRALAALEWTKMVAGLYLLSTLASLFWGGDDEEDEKLAPTEPDFWKVKNGDVRVSMGSGIGQTAMYIARGADSVYEAWTGEQLFTSEKQTRSLREITAGYTGFKLQPYWTFLLDITSKKDAIGRPTTVANTIVSSMIPLSAQTAIESVEELGLKKGLPLSVPGGSGKNVNIYDRTAPKSTETFLATLGKLKNTITGSDPSGLSKDEMKNWLTSKVKWDYDISKATKFLSPEQLEEAKVHIEKKKADTLKDGIMADPDPIKRKRGWSDLHFENLKIGRLEKIAARNDDRAEAKKMKEQLNLTYEEAMTLRLELFRRKDSLRLKTDDTYRKEMAEIDKLFKKKEESWKTWFLNNKFNKAYRDAKKRADAANK